jgi:predicted ATP-dependent endonuclease of OLD family
MKIEALKVVNFRQFEELEVKFPEITTAFVGKNGSGKTTILEALHIATSTYNPENKIKNDDFYNQSLPIKFFIKFSDFFFINIDDGWNIRKIPSKVVYLEIAPRSASGNKAFNSPYTSKFFFKPTVYEAKNTLGLDSDGLTNVPNQVLEEVTGETKKYKFVRNDGTPVEIGALQLGATQNLVGFPAVFYFDKTREKEIKKGFNTVWKKTVEELDWRFFKKFEELEQEQRDSHLGNVKSIGETINTTTTGDRRKQLITKLKKDAKKVLGDSFSTLDISFLNASAPHSKAELAVISDTKTVTLDKLGSGELATLALLLLIIASKLSKNSVILLVDELETHLHPQLQRSILKQIKSEDVQVIYTTHSENLIDLGAWKSIKRLDGAKIYPQKDTLNIEFEDEILSKHLDDISVYYHDKTILKQEDAQVLFGNKALIVEGPKDKFCLPVAASKIGKDISSIPSIVIAVGKANIPHYQLICKAFGIDSFSVFDKDTDDEEDTHKNDRIKNLANSNYFMFGTSFESAIGKSKMNEIMQEFEEGNIVQEVKDCVEAIKAWC